MPERHVLRQRALPGVEDVPEVVRVAEMQAEHDTDYNVQQRYDMTLEENSPSQERSGASAGGLAIWAQYL